jgi:hypothetical protein
MFYLARIINLLAVISLSLFSGAFIFIALVVVKFWQAVEPEVFLGWMSDHFLLTRAEQSQSCAPT